MTDALVSPVVAGSMGVVSGVLLVVAARRVKQADDEAVVPLMGVMGAFVFAVQMLNFAIPGTGASGHLVGGVLLASLLGPWGGFLVLTSVIVIQCLLFADGGLMALGCNIFNMAACSTLLAYPLLFRPLAGNGASRRRLFAASLVTCVATLELGAVCVAVETSLSGITALPFFRFLLFMLAIHLPIGLCEGVATATLLGFVRQQRSGMLWPVPFSASTDSRRVTVASPRWHLWAGLFLAALLLAGFAWWIASALPDGLEWSVEQVAGEALQ